MTSSDFIAKTYNTTSDKDRRCSSVFTDYNGTVYSYGHHYPLAFHINGLDYINEAGYSSTTSKHIAWARRALGYSSYIGVKLWRDEAQTIASSWATQEQKLKAIKVALYRQHSEILEQLASKKRTNTWIYANLQAQAAEVTANINRVNEV